MLNQLERELNDIVEALGDIYLNIAKYYPVMAEKLNGKISNISIEHKSTDSIDNLVTSLNHTLLTQTESLDGMNDEHNRFLDNMSVEIHKIERLDQYINQIEDDSSELELISLNAMVMALKAGKNGGAFPYITEELQKVSKASAALSNDLKTKGNNLSKFMTVFLESIHTDKESTSQTIHAINDDFRDLTELTMGYQKKSHNILDNIKSQTESLKEPLRIIIGEVQKHDIIRQSIDHVILAFSHIEDVPDGTAEELLENLSYASKVYEFCEEILYEIQEDLQSTFAVFNLQAKELKEVVDHLTQLGHDFKGTGTTTSYKNNVNKIHELIEQSLQEVKQGHDQAEVVVRLERTNKEISTLEDSYKGFARIINWVKTINISSRVEAAKLPHLGNMSFIIDSISSRTDSLEQNMDTISHQIIDFKKNFSALFEEFIESVNKNNAHVEEFVIHLRNLLHEVDSCCTNLQDNIYELISIGSTFQRMYKLSQLDLKKMETLINRISGIVGQVNNEKKSKQNELERILRQEGLESWELKGDQIKKLIDKFTIYIHKKKVDSDNTIEVSEEGAASGEITLF